jgi:D-alanyl-lipoteichoic acid acyltransferase DltB (MBOAT superfamily)
LSNTCLHVFKLIDYYNRYDSLSERDRGFKRFFHSFDCLYTADVRKSFVKEAVDRPGATQTLNRGLSYLAFGTAFLLLNRHFGWWRLSPKLNYLTLGVEYYFFCVGLVYIGVGIHRVLGYKVEGFFLEHTGASSPVEFWTRWNVPVHEWLRDNIHRKFGGRRHPYRGLFATFLVSGLFHEYIVSLATNTLNGFMLAYFMTQFLSVILSISLHQSLSHLFPGYSRLRLTRPFQTLKWMLTLFCILLPVPLFIHNFNKVFQLHTFKPF